MIVRSSLFDLCILFVFIQSLSHPGTLMSGFFVARAIYNRLHSTPLLFATAIVRIYNYSLKICMDRRNCICTIKYFSIKANNSAHKAWAFKFTKCLGESVSECQINKKALEDCHHSSAGSPPGHKKKRETGFEPATFALARRRSTSEPFAHILSSQSFVFFSRS